MTMLFEELIKKNNLAILNMRTQQLMTINKAKLKSEIFEIFNNLAENKTWAFAELSRKDTSYASHNYHRYPAKFIPQLARRCIQNYTNKGDLVCDPFMGCGTTVVESLIYKRKVIGIDINPVAWLITRAKSTPVEPEKIEKEVNNILEDLALYIKPDKKTQKTLINKNIKPIVPQLERIEYWFPNEKIRKELGIILSRINQIKDKDIKYFCLCGFSHILKNSSIWLMKSTKPTRNLDKEPTSPLSSFKRHIKKMLRGNRKLYETIPKDVKNNLNNYLSIKQDDARSLPCEENSVNLIVTSPPYVTSYEYADLHQLTALWLEYAKNVREFREGFIGSIYKRGGEHDGIKSELAKEEIKELSRKSNREAEAVRDYFFEMQQSFKEMYRVLKPGAKACIVIGNTQLKKVPILNAEVFVEIMINLGFKIHKIVKRKIPSKILPQTRDSETGRFTSKKNADRLAYAHEYILVMKK